MCVCLCVFPCPNTLPPCTQGAFPLTLSVPCLVTASSPQVPLQFQIVQHQQTRSQRACDAPDLRTQPCVLRAADAHAKPACRTRAFCLRLESAAFHNGKCLAARSLQLCWYSRGYRKTGAHQRQGLECRKIAAGTKTMGQRCKPVRLAGVCKSSRVYRLESAASVQIRCRSQSVEPPAALNTPAAGAWGQP